MARSLGVRFPVEVDDVRPPRHQEDLHSPARDKRAVVLIWMFAVDISVVTFDRLIEAEEQYYCSVERDSISPACLVLTQGDIAKYFQSSVVCLNDLTTLFWSFGLVEMWMKMANGMVLCFLGPADVSSFLHPRDFLT